MLEQFSDFLKRTVHQSKFPEKTISALMGASTSNDLKALLLKDEPPERLIEKLLTSADAYDIETLTKIAKTITAEDWFEVLTTKNKNGVDALTYWMQGDCKPSSNVEIILKYLQKNAHKIDILTRSIPCRDEVGDPVEYSIVTNPHLAWQKDNIIATLATCSEQEKRQVLLAVTGGPVKITALKCASEWGYDSSLVALFSDKDIRQELIDLSRKYFFRKMATHFLGMHDNDTKFEYASNSAQVTKESAKQSERVTFAGFHQHTAIPQFKRILNLYRPSLEFRDEFAKIKQAFKHDSSNKILSAYRSDQLVTISSGWPKHAIYLGAMQDYLVVANRGQGMHPKGGCIIYRLNNPLTLEDIEILQKQTSQKEIEQRISNIVKKEQNGQPEIVHALPSKGQKYGTCAVANQKALVDGLLALLTLTKYPELAADPQSKKALMDDSRIEYKRFTQFCRLTIVNELIEELTESNLNQLELIESLSDFCNQHFDKDKKSELAVLTKIIKSLSPDLKAELLKKVKPSSRILLWHLEHSQKVPPIVERLQSASLYLLRTDELKEAFTLSYEAHLNQQHSEEEAIKWFTVYFDQATTVGLDVLLAQLMHLSNEKMLSIFVADDASTFTQLLRNPDAYPIVEQVLRRMTIEERKQLLTPTVVRHIKEGGLFKLAVSDLDDAFVLELLNKPTAIPQSDKYLNEKVDYMPLSGAHDESFFRYIEERFGNERLVSMVRYVSKSGIKSNILIGARHSPGAVNFILDSMSDQDVTEMIEESKTASYYGCNMLADFAEKFDYYNTFAPKKEDLIAVLNRFVKNKPTDKTKGWLSEIDKGNQSFLHSVFQKPELIPFYLTFFSAKEVNFLVKAIDGDNLFAYPNAKAIYDHLYATLPENEFKELIVLNLSKKLERVLREFPWYENYLKQLAPNEVKKIINEEPEKYLAAAIDNPAVVDLVTVPNKWEILADVVAKSLASEFSYAKRPDKHVPLLTQIPAEFYPVIAMKLTEPNNCFVDRLQKFNPEISELISLFKLIPAPHRHLFFNSEAILGLIFHVPQYASDFVESDILTGTPELDEIKMLLNARNTLEPDIYNEINNFLKTGNQLELNFLLMKIKHTQDKQRYVVEKIFAMILPVLPIEMRALFLNREIIAQVRDTKFLHALFQGKRPNEVMALLNGCNPTVLSQAHTADYLREIEALVGSDNFKKLIDLNTLELYFSKPEAFSFIIGHLNGQELRDYIHMYKHRSSDGLNLLTAMLAKHYAMGSQDIGGMILANIQLLCSHFSKEEVKAWLLEKDLDGYCAIPNVLHDEKLFNFITTFFTPAELTPLLMDADNNWLRAARTYPRTHVFQYLENNLPPVELTRFLEPDLEATIKGMLTSKQRKSLEIVLKNSDPQKARQILKTQQTLVAQSGIDVESLFAPAEPKRESRAKLLRLSADPGKVEEKVNGIAETENVASTSNQKDSSNKPQK